MSQRRSTGRRRRRGPDSSVEKWKNKQWLEIKTPEYMDDKVLGETPASDVDDVLGRTVQISLMDITGSFKDLNYHLTFKVNEVAGRVAKTEFHQQQLSRDFRRSQIRNHRSQVEGIFNIKLSDESKIRIKMFVVTPMRIHTSIKKEIRAVMNQKLEELVSELSFPAFVNKLITYEITKEVKPVVEEVFPVKILEVSKVKVIRLPGNISPVVTAETVAS
ncbi:MAG: hypothetical protein ACW99A_09940 [Candidatus Kariarchaeaceae archaeon]|jgi:small subunit ribosomal protein S3Ae